MNALFAIVRKVVKPPHPVTVEVTKTTKVFEDGKLVETKNDATTHKEWRVVVVVSEEWVGEKEVILSRPSLEEAAKLVKGTVAYHF